MTLYLADIPTDWIGLLTYLQSQDPTAILAGGSLRDLYCGRAPKDLDFFLTNSSASFGDMAEEESDMDYEGMKYVKHVVTYSHGEIPINLIYCEYYPSVPVFLDTFDFGLCQIAFDNKDIITTQAFLWDVKYSIFTLRHGDRYSRSVARYERINERYNWPMAIGEGVEHDSNK